WILAVAGPEHAELPIDFLVGHAGVVGDTALAGHAKLLEDLARHAEGEPSGPSKRLCDVLDDAPVFARLAGTVHGLVDLDDAAFYLCHRALVLLVEAAGQHHIGVPRGVVQEEVDGDVELELV